MADWSPVEPGVRRLPRRGASARAASVLVLETVVLAALATVAWAQPPQDPRLTHCVLTLPGMDAVRVRAGLTFREVDGRSLAFDLYTPPPGTPALDGPLPAVVFVNGVGDRVGDGAVPLKDWGIYRDWARLVAVSGMAVVVHNASSEGAADDLAALFAHLRAHAAELGIDADNLALWACSANVHVGFPYAMDPARDFLKCAVIYYGNVDRALLRYDLPLLLVRAGLDTPLINNAIDAYVQRAVPANVPLTFVNVPSAIHAFDAFEDNDQSREVVKSTLAFLSENLSSGVQAARRATRRSRTRLRAARGTGLGGGRGGLRPLGPGGAALGAPATVLRGRSLSTATLCGGRGRLRAGRRSGDQSPHDLVQRGLLPRAAG